jgi:hypothetical protein
MINCESSPASVHPAGIPVAVVVVVVVVVVALVVVVVVDFVVVVVGDDVVVDSLVVVPVDRLVVLEVADGEALHPASRRATTNKGRSRLDSRRCVTGVPSGERSCHPRWSSGRRPVVEASAA